MEERRSNTEISPELTSVQRIVRILAYLAEHGTEVSMRELGAGLGLPRSTVHRICQGLATEQVLVRDARTGRYRWGEAFIKIARATYQTTHVRHLAQPLMERIVQDTNETALLVLYQPSRRQVVFTDEVECSQPVRYHAQLHVPLPLHAGASGKAILAFLADGEIQKIIQSGLDPITGNTVTEPSALMADLARIRRDGFAISHGERTPGAVGIGAPIFDGTGVVGEIMVTVPEYRCNPDLERRIAEVVTAAGHQLSQQLGMVSNAYPPVVTAQRPSS